MKKVQFRISNFQRITFLPGLMICVLLASACNQKPQTETNVVVMKQADTTKPTFTASMVDNKKDPSCGMPVTAGIHDTAHYNGKVYGFCSEECKKEFLKNPEVLAKNAELK